MKELVAKILQQLVPSEDPDKIWNRVRKLIEYLHENGPTDPDIREYLVIAAACGQKRLSGMTEYLLDKKQ